jgi:hypothetical protein
VTTGFRVSRDASFVRAGVQIVRGFSSRGGPSAGYLAMPTPRTCMSGWALPERPNADASHASGEDGMGTEAVCKIMLGTGR